MSSLCTFCTRPFRPLGREIGFRFCFSPCEVSLFDAVLTLALSELRRTITSHCIAPPLVFFRFFVHSKCSVPSPCVGQFFSCLPMYFSTSSADGTLLDYNLRLFCFCFDERRRSLEFCSSISAVRLFALVLCLPSRTCMVGFVVIRFTVYAFNRLLPCLLYTSDAADE